MRRFIIYLAVALITFTLSAFMAIQAYRRFVSEKPSQTSIAFLQDSSEDYSESKSQSVVEQVVRPEIPASIKVELNKRFPGWRFPLIDPEIGKYLRSNFSPDASPELVRGDFDGNGQQDYAVFIEWKNSLSKAEFAESEAVLAVFMKSGNKFKFHRLYPSEYIALIKKGERGYNYETDKNFVYKNDSIFTGYWEKAGSSYVYEKGKFKEITTSD